MKLKNVLLIDGHNFLFRSFYVPFEFHTHKGTPLHVVSTFLKLLRRSVSAVSKETALTHIGVIFDSDICTFRKKLRDDYKAGRKKFEEGEDSPYKHAPIVRQALDDLGIFNVEVTDLIQDADIEADDLIGTLANNLQKDRFTFISSADTDFYQLISERVNQLHLKKKDKYEFVNPDYIKTKLSINPEDYVLYKSLKGDSADNISGISGIGPVRAAKIINGEYNIDLEKYKDVLELNEKLISLKFVDVDEAIFSEMGFEMNCFDKSNPDIFKSCDF